MSLLHRRGGKFKIGCFGTRTPRWPASTPPTSGGNHGTVWPDLGNSQAGVEAGSAKCFGTPVAGRSVLAVDRYHA